MSQISSYKRKNKPMGSDIMIGTSVEDGQTKNFSVNALSIAAVNVYLGSNSFKFVTDPNESGNRPEASISFENYEGDNTPFSSITSLHINTIMLNGSYSIAYLTRLISENIVISDRRDLDRYGVYRLDSLTLISGDVYEMGLTFIEGNSSIHNLHYYGVAFEPSINADKTFVHNHASPSAIWNIQHNLNKFPSVTSVNINNIEVKGEIEYTDLNNLTIKFSAGFSGKAYLN
jgi:hypothetical protein